MLLSFLCCWFFLIRGRSFAERSFSLPAIVSGSNSHPHTCTRFIANWRKAPFLVPLPLVYSFTSSLPIPPTHPPTHPKSGRQGCWRSASPLEQTVSVRSKDCSQRPKKKQASSTHCASPPSPRSPNDQASRPLLPQRKGRCPPTRPSARALLIGAGRRSAAFVGG